MNKIIKWVKNNWTDPVWSKVFATIILSLLGALGFFVESKIEQIPIAELYQKSLNTYVSINYFTIIITILILLTFLVPAILMDIIRFQLKHLKFPIKFKSEKFDLQQFLSGQWFLVYTHKQSTLNGNESVIFVNGNHYYIGNTLVFILTDIDFNESKKELKWAKTRYDNNKIHSKETLTIADNNTISGVDDLGFAINYVRIDKTTPSVGH